MRTPGFVLWASAALAVATPTRVALASEAQPAPLTLVVNEEPRGMATVLLRDEDVQEMIDRSLAELSAYLEDSLQGRLRRGDPLDHLYQRHEGYRVHEMHAQDLGGSPGGRG